MNLLFKTKRNEIYNKHMKKRLKKKLFLSSLLTISTAITAVSSVSCITDYRLGNFEIVHGLIQMEPNLDVFNSENRIELTKEKFELLVNFNSQTDSVSDRKALIESIFTFQFFNDTMTSEANLADNAAAELQFGYIHYKDSSNNNKTMYRVFLKNNSLSQKYFKNITAQSIGVELPENYDPTLTIESAKSLLTIYQSDYYIFNGIKLTNEEINTLIKSTDNEAKARLLNSIYSFKYLLTAGQSININASEPLGSRFVFSPENVNNFKTVFSLRIKSFLNIIDESYYMSLFVVDDNSTAIYPAGLPSVIKWGG
ncbi:hypothetical protein EI74_0527 [Mycoplasma testudineum]|uniref:Uncharacterized protein n=2 Tax=Mycoplasma testudineum TaxID=244584 RepID=A0A4R6IE58_9MOLU|nr:hypothetical protein EI74_0527 [Mycoplasma testudineum]